MAKVESADVMVRVDRETHGLLVKYRDLREKLDTESIGRPVHFSLDVVLWSLLKSEIANLESVKRKSA